MEVVLDLALTELEALQAHLRERPGATILEANLVEVDHVQETARVAVQCGAPVPAVAAPAEIAGAACAPSELKLKGPRERTVSTGSPTATSCTDRLSPQAQAFLHKRLQGAYGWQLVDPLVPTLATCYLRTTLVVPERVERLTCDVGLRFAGGGLGGRLADGLVIIESKSPAGCALADRVLGGLGCRPPPLQQVLPWPRAYPPRAAGEPAAPAARALSRTHALPPPSPLVASCARG